MGNWRNALLLCAALLVWHSTAAQDEYRYANSLDDLPQWAQLMYAPDPDPGEVTKAYNAYYRLNVFERNSHTQYYKRWIRSISRDQATDGRSIADRKYRAMLQNEANSLRSSSDPWVCIGPFDWDHDAADRSYAPGAAHVYTVEQSKSDPTVLYAGAATAGIWKSVDAGLNWTSVTEGMVVNQVKALEINHENHDIVYAGILSNIYRSSNGGVSWQATGDAAFQDLSFSTVDISMHPQDTQKIFAATNSGLYRTDNSGQTWELKLAGDILEIEYHPTDPDTVYVVLHNNDRTQFFRSTNGGNAFVQQTNGWPVPDVGAGEHQRRTEIAVTPADPDRVVALATGSANGGSGLYGLYTSNDAGATWSFECCGPQPAGPPSESNPNLMGWSDLGLDDGGQYYYDLALDISPTNADSIFVAGVNLWISDDGGMSFVCPAKWSHPYKPGYVHADVHDIRYYADTREIWLACDGGIFYSNDGGLSFTRRMFGISGTDFWGFGAGERDAQVMLGGTYHNGTLLKDNAVYINGWLCTDGGDNYRGFVHPVNDRQAFSDYNIKTLSGDREVNSQTRAFSNKPNASYIIGESSDILFHPTYSDTWYTGSGTILWKTEDNGLTFTVVHDFGVDVAAMDLCFTHPEVLYVTTFPGWWDAKTIWRSSDGGGTWTEITPPTAQLDGNLWVPYDIAVSALDPDEVWIARTSMYGSTDLNGAAVFKSSDGGTTWSNITADLPAVEALTCIAHQKGSEGTVYLGTRRGVYVTNNALDGWELFAAGLPVATVATRLIPDYWSQRIRNATNRSVWERSLYESSDPIAQISLEQWTGRCLPDTVFFKNNSVMSASGAEFNWSFPGGLPSTSSERDPVIVYTDPGIYDVSLSVSDTFGTSTRVFEGVVRITDECGLDDVAGLAMRAVEHPDHAILQVPQVEVDSITITAWVKPDGIQNDYTGIVMNDGSAAGMNFRGGNNTLGYHWPGGAWSWDSGLIVEPGVWSYVAMVVTPNSVSLSVNGVESVHNTSLDPVTLGTMRVGSYHNWGDRNFSGMIDEVCIYDRALTLDEIRAGRHLTKDPGNDPSQLVYLQFNEGGTTIFDKASGWTASLNGQAYKARSRAPLGRGVSSRKLISAQGTYNFDNTGLEIEFGSGATLPAGDVWVSKLAVSPDTMPMGFEPLQSGYWIIDNYGANAQWTDPIVMHFAPVGYVSDSIASGLGVDLLGRGPNSDTGGWAKVSGATSMSPGYGGSVMSGQFPGYAPGQLIAVRDSLPFGKAAVTIGLPGMSTMVRGGASSEIGINGSGFRGLKLPVLNTQQFEQLPSPVQGMFAYHDEEKTLCVFRDSNWYLLEKAFLDLATSTGGSPSAGLFASGADPGGSVIALPDSGAVLPPAMTHSDLLAIDYPRTGLIVFDTDSSELLVFDGSEWCTLLSGISDISVNSQPAGPSVGGIAAGVTQKAPHAVLHVASFGKGLGLPAGDHRNVVDPAVGLAIFDVNLKRICFFDGVAWYTLKCH